MRHKYVTCDCNEPYYPICQGLSVCSVCHGAEASLTYHCCGRRLTDEEDRLILNKKLDYVNGFWVNFSKDCEIEYYRIKGQGVNETGVGVSITHKKSGIYIRSGACGSRINNIFRAKRKLLDCLRKL